MPYVLDTDHISIMRKGEGAESDRLLSRLDAVPADDLAVTIVSFQEECLGWTAAIHKTKRDSQIILFYAELELTLRAFSRMNVLSFSSEAQSLFSALRRQCRRVATLDLRIASIALATGSTLLTRNARDFGQVPGLVVEDWTR